MRMDDTMGNTGHEQMRAPDQQAPNRHDPDQHATGTSAQQEPSAVSGGCADGAAGAIPEDDRLESYRFHLPEDQIAQHPAPQRGGSRLLVLDRRGAGAGTLAHARFADLCDHLPEGCLLVANNSKVLPARLLGLRPTGGKVEFLLLTPLPLLEELAGGDTGTGSRRDSTGEGLRDEGEGWLSVPAEGLLRASKKIRTGDVMDFGPHLRVEVIQPGDFGRSAVRLHWRGDLRQLFLAQGHLPLPPYIRRETGAVTPDAQEDRDRYQTVYADDSRLGSVAAPTAGLHFTDDLRARLAATDRQWAEVTLYVGYGTFSPVRCADIRQHAMHREYIEVGEATAAAIRAAKAEGRPVVTVGTTSTRTLEGTVRACGEVRAFTGWTDIFIKPGYRFTVADHIITNFHLPESSLLMLVSAFAGRRRVLSAYAEAVARGYRFFSYGDAMLLL
ncbi:tRNA preQ1(34) S-adenosylmethionine ribosyltransferase-isomerase QueA [Nitratidesulfovibrio liaohensis]|uniref:tRNA preQ1(34) S-adenosylmethionine ribosyltransferase-isomerase QueA n=1 Tax=Nitratidesulfovibrio liaohensis TaxID=2604158 RepID=UPI001FB9397F|nr:tRNA preQ1(34) S-adenosylmethionine ribosyltransferase-isomerase QueA [Nitratidesulfovibrio liaohensis]NHZ47938.1 tRNA preQ1(34) S-adenosylmethionine ribosyltransferase-isomerase QueA [Nitratidesulfovibrio liaohensis]